MVKMPSCTTRLEYDLWKIAARIVRPGSAGFCADCTPEYAERMRAEGKCDHPEILFNDEGGYKPTYYHRKKIKLLQEKQNGI